jgi:hypothetical protein
VSGMEIIGAGWVHLGPVGVNVEGFRVSIAYGHLWCRVFGFRRQRQQGLAATRLQPQQREGYLSGDGEDGVGVEWRSTLISTDLSATCPEGSSPVYRGT